MGFLLILVEQYDMKIINRWIFPNLFQNYKEIRILTADICGERSIKPVYPDLQLNWFLNNERNRCSVGLASDS